MNEYKEGDKYVLCRRVIDGFNEVKKAGPNATTAIGAVDFHRFMTKHDLHPLLLTQFLKISYRDVELINNHGGFIELHAQENLLQLAKIPKNCRQFLCKFMMSQDSNAGQKNVHPKCNDKEI